MLIAAIILCVEIRQHSSGRGILAQQEDSRATGNFLLCKKKNGDSVSLLEIPKLLK